MADSPGGVEEGRVSIRVVPDTSKFATDLRGDLKRIAAEINFAIKVDLDNSGLDEKAKLAAKEAQAAAGNINIKTNVDNSQIAELKKGLTGIEGQTEGIGSSIGFWQGLILAAVAAVAVFGPALALLLPIIASVGLAAAAIALTLNGLKKVFAPLIDGIKALTKPLTKTITQGLKPFVKEFTTAFIPVLKAGLTASAQILNQVAKAFLSLGRDSAFMKDLQSFIVGAAIAFRPLVNVIPLVAKAFVQIGAAALPALLALTKGFAGVLIDFSNAITRLAASGQLTKIINNAASALSALLGATTAILGQLLKLGAFLAPTFTAVFNAVGPLAKVVSVELVGAFQTLQPVIQAVFNFFSQNKNLLAGLAVALLAVVSPVTLLAAAIVVLLANFKTIQPILQTVFAAIVNATIPLQQAFTSVVTAAQGLFTVLAPIVTQIVALFIQNWPQIQQVVIQVFSTIQTIIVTVLTVIATEFQIWAGIVSFIWTKFGADILATLAKVLPDMLASISGTLHVIQGLFQFFTDLLHGNWSAMWTDIQTIASGAVGAVKNLIKVGLDALQGIANVAIKAFVLAFASLGAKVLTEIGDISGDFVKLGEEITAGIAKGIANVPEKVGDAVKGVIKGALHAGKVFAGVGSPSKLYADEIGQWLSLGIAAGVVQHSGAVSNAVVKAVSPPNIAGLDAATGTTASGSPGILFTGPVGMQPEDVAKAITNSQRDAAVVANLQALLVG